MFTVKVIQNEIKAVDKRATDLTHFNADTYKITIPTVEDNKEFG